MNIFCLQTFRLDRLKVQKNQARSSEGTKSYLSKTTGRTTFCRLVFHFRCVVLFKHLDDDSSKASFNIHQHFLGVQNFPSLAVFFVFRLSDNEWHVGK